MSDLIVIINTSASKKNGFLILETYYTKKVDVNKSGKYKGGSISTADILNCMPVENCNYKFVRTFFKEKCYQLSLNCFYITNNNFHIMLNDLNMYKIVFLDNPDKSLFLIDHIVENKPVKKTKYKYYIGNLLIHYYSDNSVYIEKMQSELSEINQIAPSPYLFFSQKEQVYSLYFNYFGENIPFLDKRLSVRKNDKIYLRNYSFENTICDTLKKEQFIKLAQHHFIYSGHKNKRMLSSDLSLKNIVINNDDNIIIPDIKITKSELGWFEIDLTCTIDQEVMNLASKIQLFSSQDEIELGDKKIQLPNSILQAREYLSIQGDKLRIEQKHIFELLHIIYESDSEINEFFSYSNVKLNISDTITNTAFPYQLEGMRWLKFLFLNHFGGCLADDMGLGKTFQFISFLEDDDVKRSIDKILIVVPKSLLTNWKKEFRKFHSSYHVGIYHGDKRREFNFDNCDVIITTYNTAYLDLKKLNEFEYSVVLYDEIQIIKNYKSIISEAMKKIKSSIKIGLSGTPMENSISELWNIMDILNPNVFYSHTYFMRRYSGKNYDELKNILNIFILRRLKKDVLKELPPKYEQIIYCDMEQKQKNLYTSINIVVKREIMNLKAFAAPVVLKGLTLLRECCCHPLLLDEKINVDKVNESCKFDALNILVDNLVASGHKILIFSNYTSMLNLIMKELKQSKRYRDIIYYLDGQTNNRNEIVNQFETAKEGIFLISIKAGGVGLNLISAQDVIIYDPWWNPFVEQQAIDRAYRIGQDKSVTVYKLVVANTLEERIIEMQKDKQENFNELINGISANKNINLKDILNLIQ